MGNWKYIGKEEEYYGWVEEHPEETPSRAILIYAWNEHDEGG